MTSSCVLLALCLINQGLTLCFLSEGKAEGVETNETELLLCQTCTFNSVFDPFSGHPTALRVSAHLLQQTTSSTCLGGQLSGQLRGICPGGVVQDLRLPLGPALLSGG